MKKNFWQITALLFIFISLLAYLFAPKSIKKMLLRSRAYTNELNIRIKLQGEYDKIDSPSFNTKVVLYNQTGKVKEYTDLPLTKQGQSIFSLKIDTTGLMFNTPYAIFIKPDKYLGKLFCSSTAYSKNCTTPQITISSGSHTLYLTQSLFLSGDISIQDGKISAEDISKILKQIGQVTTDYLSGDINSDKKVESVDYSLALYSLSQNAVDDPITLIFSTITPTPTTGTPTNVLTPTNPLTPTPTVIPTTTTIPTPTTAQIGKCVATYKSDTIERNNNTSGDCICENTIIGQICVKDSCSNCPSGTCSCGEIPEQRPPTTMNCSNGGIYKVNTCTQ